MRWDIIHTDLQEGTWALKCNGKPVRVFEHLVDVIDYISSKEHTEADHTAYDMREYHMRDRQ